MNAYIVEREDLIHNINCLKEKAGKVPIWAVLKGNGYGIGVVPLARTLWDQGITHFCVTEVREAQLIREAGYADATILMLRSISDPSDINQLMDLGVILSVGSTDVAIAVNGIAGERGEMAEVHLKIDTGMGRYGFLPSETEKIISVYQYMKNIIVGGIYTHFPCAPLHPKVTQKQFATFQSVIKTLHAEGYETGIVHCCNSAAFLRYPEMMCDGVRIGSALLGRLPTRSSYGLRPIGHAEALIEEIRWLPKGHTSGYAAAWKAKAPTRIAVVGLGWYNGFGCERKNDVFRFRDCFRGALGNVKNWILRKKLLVSINDQKCRVLGHVSMVHTVVDVTDIQCSVGDKVVMQISPLLVRGMKVHYR